MSRRIQKFNDYLRAAFGCRVQRIALDAGLTCPNRDGTKGVSGCIFCDNTTFNPNAGSRKSIAAQIAEGKINAFRKTKARKYLAYFQTFTNTYAPVDHLKKMYLEALNDPDIVGLIISTRPDCMPDDVLKLFIEIASGTLLWIEIGVQTSWDRTLRLVNRCHTWSDSVASIEKCVTAGLNVAAHVILGLPGESEQEIISTAVRLCALRIKGIKLHHLYAATGTRLAAMYEAGEWVPLRHDEYIPIAARFLSLLPDDTILMRLSSDCPKNRLVAPVWPLSKQDLEQQILNTLDLITDI